MSCSGFLKDLLFYSSWWTLEAWSTCAFNKLVRIRTVLRKWHDLLTAKEFIVVNTAPESKYVDSRTSTFSLKREPKWRSVKAHSRM